MPDAFSCWNERHGEDDLCKGIFVGRRKKEKGLARQLTQAEDALKCASSTIAFVFDDPDKLSEVKNLRS